MGLDRKKLYKNHYAIDPKIADRAVEDYCNGKSASAIAKELGICNKTVYAYVRRAGKIVRPKIKYKVITKELKVKIVYDYEIERLTIRQIAKKYKICVPVVHDALKETDCEMGVAESNKRRSLPSDELRVNKTFTTYKRIARKRNIKFLLTKKQVQNLIFDACAYCNRERVNGDRDGSYNGIDRIDNTKGYIASNVVSCCGECNRSKSDKTLDEFLKWIELIYNLRIKK